MKTDIISELAQRETTSKLSKDEINNYIIEKFKNNPFDNPLNWKNNFKDESNLQSYIGPCINCFNKDICFSKIFFNDGTNIRQNPVLCSTGCSYEYAFKN